MHFAIFAASFLVATWSVAAGTIALGDDKNSAAVPITTADLVAAGAGPSDNVVITNAASLHIDGIAVHSLRVIGASLTGVVITNATIARTVLFLGCAFNSSSAVIIHGVKIGGDVALNVATPAVEFSASIFPADSALLVSDVTVGRRTHVTSAVWGPRAHVTAVIGFDGACSIGRNTTHTFRNVTLEAFGSYPAFIAGIEYAPTIGAEFRLTVAGAERGNLAASLIVRRASTIAVVIHGPASGEPTVGQSPVLAATVGINVTLRRVNVPQLSIASGSDGGAAGSTAAAKEANSTSCIDMRDTVVRGSLVIDGGSFASLELAGVAVGGRVAVRNAHFFESAAGSSVLVVNTTIAGDKELGTPDPVFEFSNVVFANRSLLVVSNSTLGRRAHVMSLASGMKRSLMSTLIRFGAGCVIGAGVIHAYVNVTLHGFGSYMDSVDGILYEAVVGPRFQLSVNSGSAAGGNLGSSITASGSTLDVCVRGNGNELTHGRPMSFTATEALNVSIHRVAVASLVIAGPLASSSSVSVGDASSSLQLVEVFVAAKLTVARGNWTAVTVTDARIAQRVVFDRCHLPRFAAFANVTVAGDVSLGNDDPVIAFNGIVSPNASTIAFHDLTVGRQTHAVMLASSVWRCYETSLIAFDANCVFGSNVTHELGNVTLNAFDRCPEKVTGFKYASTAGYPRLLLVGAYNNTTASAPVVDGTVGDARRITPAALADTFDGIGVAAPSALPTLVLAPGSCPTAFTDHSVEARSRTLSTTRTPSATRALTESFSATGIAPSDSASLAPPLTLTASPTMQLSRTLTTREEQQQRQEDAAVLTATPKSDTAPRYSHSAYADVTDGEPAVRVAEPMAPTAVIAAASLVSAVLLPAAASKPFANARALGVADACAAFVHGDDDLEGLVLAAEPGEWPSDYAVIVARWEVGDGGGSAARARGAGAALAVAVAAVATLALCAVGAVQQQPASATATTSKPDDGASASSDRRPRPVSAAYVRPTAAVVLVAYLVPNALEAAVVAATASGATLAAGALAAVAMLTTGAPLFVASVAAAAAAGNAAPPRPIVERLAAFVEPVLVLGLRDEAAPLLRAHGLLDFAAACAIAALSGATQAGVRVGGSCVLAAALMFAAALGLTAYYALVRPFAARLEVAVAGAQSGTLAVLCGLTLAAVATDGSAVSAGALSAAGMAAEAVTFAVPVVLLVPVIHGCLHSKLSARSSPEPLPANDDDEPLLEVPAIHHRQPSASSRDDVLTSHVAVISNPLVR